MPRKPVERKPMKERIGWAVHCFGSGTMIVQHQDFYWPHFYVYGPHDADDAKRIANRHRVCEDIRDHMNGGPRPVWLDDMHRTTEVQAFDNDGTNIFVVGRMYDRNPPHLDWQLDESDEAQSARARLMDQLFGIGLSKVRISAV